jgi:hypothetical protein
VLDRWEDGCGELESLELGLPLLHQAEERAGERRHF